VPVHINHHKDSSKKVILIIGPTAVGKTEIAVNLSKELDIEVISCDSMQIYKGMALVSAAPDAYIRKKLKHHLVAELPAEKEYSVADFIKISKGVINDIHKKGKIPVFVGGSGLYMKALIDGIFIGPAADNRLRAQLYKQAKKYGRNYLYDRLKTIDPVAAAKIHPANIRKIIRAIEVFKLTKTPISILQKDTEGILKGFNVYIFGLNLKRHNLYQRIDERVEEMFKKGLIGEIKKLLRKRLSKTANQAIGIDEMRGYLEARYDLNEAKRLMKRNSRHFAKRQLTWFRKESRIKWINVDNKSHKKVAEIILRKI